MKEVNSPLCDTNVPHLFQCLFSALIGLNTGLNSALIALNTDTNVCHLFQALMPDSMRFREPEKKRARKEEKIQGKKSQESRYRQPACTWRAVMQSERMSRLLRGRLGCVYRCCCFCVEGGRFADTCEDTHAALVFGVDYGRKTGRGSSRGRGGKGAHWCSPPVLRLIQALFRHYEGFLRLYSRHY